MGLLLNLKNCHQTYSHSKSKTFSSVPREVLEDYKLTSMTLEFRRECTQSDLLESMSSSSSSNVVGASNNNSVNTKPNLQYIHLLRLQDNKAELVRARTEWLLKQKPQVIQGYI